MEASIYASLLLRGATSRPAGSIRLRRADSP